MSINSVDTKFQALNVDAPILVIDSGLGGVSILNALQKKLPKEKFIYFADYAFLPYGEKSEIDIQNRCIEIITVLQQEDIKAVVLACNSATAAAISYLRKHFRWEFFGTEPGIKPAAKESKLGIAVLATTLTLKSAQFAKLLEQYAKEAPVFILPAPELVLLVENGEFANEAAGQVLDKVLKKIDGKFDTLLLGCTHFSFLKQQFSSKLGKSVTIIDTSDAIASRVQYKLSEKQLLQLAISHKTELTLKYTVPSVLEKYQEQLPIEDKINLLKSSLSNGFILEKIIKV